MNENNQYLTIDDAREHLEKKVSDLEREIREDRREHSNEHKKMTEVLIRLSDTQKEMHTDNKSLRTLVEQSFYKILRADNNSFIISIVREIVKGITIALIVCSTVYVISNDNVTSNTINLMKEGSEIYEETK